MSTQTLRELAKEYALGNIDKDRYRKSRTELIQGIVSGKVAVKSIDYVEPLKPPTDLEDAITEGINRDRDTTQITSPDHRPAKPANTSPSPQQIATTEKNSKSPFVFIIASAIIVVILIVAVVLFYPKPPEAEIAGTLASTSKSNASAGTEAATTQSAAAETLIGNFLNEKNWNEANLDSFVSSWNELSQEDKEASANTKRMQRLKSTIYKQFLEGKALASIDAAKAIEKQQKLIDFANAIGVEDSRLKIE